MKIEVQDLTKEVKKDEKIHIYRAWYALWDVYWKRNWSNSICHHEQCVIFYSSGIWDNPWVRNRKFVR